MKKIGIIILAAGESKRMGTPKQLLDISGISLLRRTVSVALATDLDPVVLVVGANKPQIVPEIADLRLTIIDNSMWRTGMASSVKMGMAALWMNNKNIDAVLMLVCDQPFLTVEVLNRLIAQYQQKKPPIVACQYAGQVGVPAVFDRTIFEELLNLTGDKGAKPILMNHLDEVHLIDFEDGIIDLDTPEDYEKLKSKQM
jgi:molybdenum cofactor cytidylyltransferase